MLLGVSECGRNANTNLVSRLVYCLYFVQTSQIVIV